MGKFTPPYDNTDDEIDRALATDFDPLHPMTHTYYGAEVIAVDKPSHLAAGE